MDTAHFRKIFEDIVPRETVETAAAANNLQLRERKKDVPKLIYSMIASSANGDGGRQAKAIKRYFDDGGPRTSRSASYEWFDNRLSATLKHLAEGALSNVRAQKVDLPGWIGQYVKDWYIVDSTTVKIDDDLFETYPGVGDYAAIKVHKTMSVGVGTVIDYKLTPARDHDSKHLKIDSSWENIGLLADLGYASYKTIHDCEEFGAKYVMRLKDNWKPKIQTIHRGGVENILVKECDFDLVLKNHIKLNGNAVDLAGTIEKHGETISVRIVGVCTSSGSYRFYITNLPRRVGPQQISDLYRVRWEIEGDNKLNKSCFSLDDIGSRTVGALHCMIHAAMIGSIIACLIVHAHNMKNRPEPSGREVPERDYAPLHPRLVASYMSTASQKIAEVFFMEEDAADAEWDRLGELILFLGKDINWKRSPSILDQIRGWHVHTVSRGITRKTSK